MSLFLMLAVGVDQFKAGFLNSFDDAFAAVRL
jgi:hypothetical protein